VVKSRNPVIPKYTFDGPGITVKTMEKEQSRKQLALRAEKLKVGHIVWLSKLRLSPGRSKNDLNLKMRVTETFHTVNLLS
jgi:hypothetical protein